MSTLLLKFAGPLQSFGVSSKFETRHTEKYPSKSAVIGMIAGALGKKRDDESINVFNQLDFGVRIDQPGSIINDYHIARKYKNNGSLERTYVTNRYYIQDAVFIVGLSSEDEQILKEIEIALNQPYYQPFLGRRANPVTIDFIQGRTELDLISSLENHPWQAAEWYRKQNNDIHQLTAYLDSDLTNASLPNFFVKDNVKSFSQRDRQFGFRSVTRVLIPLSNDRRIYEHNIFETLE